MNIKTMLLAVAVVGAAGTSAVAASSITSEDASVVVQNQPDEPKARSSGSSQTVPETTGQNQPQGPTGPINTATEGGAPAESPQGETPPGMQSAPEGSSKTTVEPKQ